MTPGNPIVIVTLPGRTVSEVRRQAELCRDAGGDMGEVRLDRWSAEERSRAGTLFPSPLPLVATLRSGAEGGEGADEPVQRSTELLAAARLPFRWIDLEEERDIALIDRLPPTASLGRILSTHFPEGTPASELAVRIGRTSPVGTVRKAVIPATTGAVLREILPILPDRERRSCVVLTTGPSGALLRAWSRRLGFPFVYASLPASFAHAAAQPVEASQIPVDRLRHFFAGGDEAPLFAVTGHPVDHSLSPHVHSRWMRAGHLHGIYVALDIASESEFLESLGPLAEGGFRGLNVTHPWKTVALQAASRVGPGANRCRAANCLTFRAGEIEAENTDLAAVLRRLEELRSAGAWDGAELAVIGAGGAASATLAAAQELAVEAHVVSRDEARAATLAVRFDARVLPKANARPFSLVVQATPVGRRGAGPLEVPLGALVRRGTQVLDWVYAASDPVVRSATESAGGRYEDGWRLLVYQAVASFGIWWGEEPSSEEIEGTVAEGPCTG